VVPATKLPVDGKPRSCRDQEEAARQAATHLKTKQPGTEVTVRDLETGTSTVIKHPLDR
jgi:hypothetical protein